MKEEDDERKFLVGTAVCMKIYRGRKEHMAWSEEPQVAEPREMGETKASKWGEIKFVEAVFQKS